MTERVALQLATLRERVERACEALSAEAREAAALDVGGLLGVARRESRRKVGAAARAKRERVRERCRQALADLEAARRRSDFDSAGRWIAAARAQLPMALARRWLNPAGRSRWCDTAIAISARRLVGRDWQIEVAPGLDPRELAALGEAAARAGARAQVIVAAQDAGLRISAGETTVDATPVGLLADSAAVDAALLAAREASTAGARP
ncbi:MAG TPA: hypothetical protein VN787_00790 [Steroidobacteraceae bacterium]|nr:hypothetical protein [Steroidobacteraceae bacterium]